MRTALLTILALALAAPAPASACSKFPLHALLDDRAGYFIGAALEDTLLAGPGEVTFDRAAAPERAIYGQLHRVEAIGGPAAAGLPEGVEEVVLVPWGYRSDCAPTIWRESARWVDPGARGFYLAELRPREEWVGERPTFDVHNTYHTPYLAGERPSPTMTLEEVFALYEALPSTAQIDTEGYASLGPVRDWIGANADLAGSYPATLLIDEVSSFASRAYLSSLEHPAHGTWRFDIELPGGVTRTVFGRTDPRVTSEWNVERIPPVEGRTMGRLDPPISPPGGLTLLLRVWGEEREPAATEPVQRMGYLHTLALPPLAGPEIHSWEGWIDWNFLRAALGDHPVAQQIIEAERERYRARSAARLPVETPATFTRDAGGVLRFHQSYALDDGGEVTVRGVQVPPSAGR